LLFKKNSTISPEMDENRRKIAKRAENSRSITLSPVPAIDSSRQKRFREESLAGFFPRELQKCQNKMARGLLRGRPFPIQTRTELKRFRPDSPWAATPLQRGKKVRKELL
jgi:hypothetical protein